MQFGTRLLSPERTHIFLPPPPGPDARHSGYLVVNTNSSSFIHPSRTACVAWIWSEAILGQFLFICVETVLVIRGQLPFRGRGRIIDLTPLPHISSVCVLRTEQNPSRLHHHTIRGRNGGAVRDHRHRGAVHRNRPRSTAVNEIGRAHV